MGGFRTLVARPPLVAPPIEYAYFLSSVFSFFPHIPGFKGEVPAIGGERKKRILDHLKRTGIEWNDKISIEPVDMGNGVEGFLKGLSVILTGSLLHLPLIKVSFSTSIL